MRTNPSTRPNQLGRAIFATLIAVLLGGLAPNLCSAQGGPPGEPLNTDPDGDTKKVCDALDALHCAVDAMDESDPNRKKAEKALDAALKAKKGKKNPETDEFEPRIRKRKLEKKGHDAFTNPEADDGTNVSGTEEVGVGDEYVILGDHWLPAGPSSSGDTAKLAGLLAHEGVRLTQKYNYPKKMIPVPEFCKILDRTIEAWTVHIAVLKALEGKETDPGEKKKITDRIKDAEGAKEGKEKAKQKLGCQ